MAFQFQNAKRKVLRKGEAPRLRREFGLARFAYIGNTAPGADIRVGSEISTPRAPYTLPWDVANGDPITVVGNKYGQALALPAGDSAARTYWVSTTASPLSGLTESSIIFVGDGLTSENVDVGVLDTNVGGSNQDLTVGDTNGWRVFLRQTNYGTSTYCGFSTATGPGSACWSWRAAAWTAFRNGVAADSVSGTISSIVSAAGFRFLSQVAYARPLQANMVIWTDRAVPGPLALAVSLDPYEAFQPIARAFYYPSSADSEAPTWTGGSTVDPSSVTHNSMTITWDAATDNVAVTQYRYRLNTGAWTTLGDVLTDDLTGLVPGTSYAIDVQAGDVNGNWSDSLSVTQATQDIGIQPVLRNPSGDSLRANETGIKVLILGEAPGSTATPTVLASSAAETTDGSGVLDVRISESGLDPADIVWLVAVKSDGVPANAGWSVCWPQAVVAI